jgi:hypothetical protein
MINRILLLSSSIFLIAVSAIATETKEPDYNPDLLIFAGELRAYVEKATELSQITSEKSEEKEKLVGDLKATGMRMARVYFSETTETIQNELNKHLSLTLKANLALKNYFVFMGNAFSELAEAFVKKHEEHQKKVRLLSTAGGAFLGVLVGGGYLYFKVRHAASSAAALSGKDYLIAGGALAAGTAIGFGFGTVYATKLPMDNSVKNAKDFDSKYPHGEDFINQLERSSDLKLLMSEL